MKCLALVLLAAALAPTSAFAQGTITSDAGYPKSDVVGQASDSGKYTLDPGYTIVGISMYARPVAGGSGGTAVATVVNANTSYTAAIDGLTSKAKYNVFSLLTVTKGGIEYHVFTPDVLVTIK